MRRLALVLLALVSSFPRPRLAGRTAPGDGTLSFQDADGTVTSVEGRASSATSTGEADVIDRRPRQTRSISAATRVDFKAREARRGLQRQGSPLPLPRPARTRSSSTAAGIDLSAVGKGRLNVAGETRRPVRTAPSRLNGAKATPLPLGPRSSTAQLSVTRDREGPTTDQPTTLPSSGRDVDRNPDHPRRRGRNLDRLVRRALPEERRLRRSGPRRRAATRSRSGGRARPALIVLDLMLPDIDGIEVCRRSASAPTCRS